MEKSFGVSHEVAILGISLFVDGLGTGLLLVGPLSELYSRNLVYRVSYLLFLAFAFPVVFANDAGELLPLVVHHLLRNALVFLVFRFITGFCGSALLIVAGGSVVNLFDDAHVATSMAIYTMTPFIGPGRSLSSFLGGPYCDSRASGGAFDIGYCLRLSNLYAGLYLFSPAFRLALVYPASHHLPLRQS
jgi:MFS family permease